MVADPRAPEEVDPKEISPPKTQTWLKKHKTSSTTVYQRTGKTDPKDPRRYKRLPLKIEKLTKHMVQMEKGSLLRWSGVSFRSAADESLIESRRDECTPGPSKIVPSTPAPSESSRYKRKAEKGRIAKDNARRLTKQRIEEYSADESEDDDDSEWEIERSETMKGAANQEDDVPSVREKSPRSVGGKRKKNQKKASVNQQRGNQHDRDAELTKWGVMIHRIEHK